MVLVFVLVVIQEWAEEFYDTNLNFDDACMNCMQTAVELSACNIILSNIYGTALNIGFASSNRQISYDIYSHVGC